MSDHTFALPIEKLRDTGQPEVSREATGAKAPTLDPTGLLPPNVLAPTPTDAYVLTWDSATNKPKWAVIPTPVAPTIPTVIAPTHIGSWVSAGFLAVSAANTAYLSPIQNIITPTTITRIAFGVGTASGNMDIGIYFSDDESTFTRLFAQGSFATPATGAIKKTVASTTLTPVAGRRWYWGFGCDNTTATFDHVGAVPPGYKKAASFPLPSSITGATALVRGTDVLPTMVGMV